MAIDGRIDASPAPCELIGWARDKASADPLTIEATLDGEVIARTTNDQPRDDVGGQYGFLLKLPEPPDDELARSGRLQIAVRAGDHPPLMLHWPPALLETLRSRKPRHQAAPLTLAQMIDALGQSTQPAGQEPPPTPEDRHAPAPPDAIVPVVKAPIDPENFTEPLTYFATAPAFISQDGRTIVGLNGHLFLCEGSNRLSEQFRLTPDDPAVKACANGWITLLRTRAAALAQRDIRFVQTIIPEKVSVVPEYWPGPIVTPSSTLRTIEAALIDEPFYMSAHRALANSDERVRAYRKIDTHLTWYGATALFEAICRFLGIEPPFDGSDLAFDHKIVDGDIASSFSGIPIVERVDLPRSDKLHRAAADVRTVFARDAAPNRVVGTHYRWFNPDAPINKKVLVFGNSFVTQNLGPGTLSYWFVRVFREFEFFWNPDIDLKVIDESKPDIVVAQTVERFLPRVPEV